MMTREQLDALAAEYTETFGSDEHDEFTVTMQENWLALIAQARRAIELEEGIGSIVSRISNAHATVGKEPLMTALRDLLEKR